MEFSREEYQSGFPFPSPGDLPNPGTELEASALWADSLPSEPKGKSKMEHHLAIKKSEKLPLAATWMDLEIITLSEM